MKTHWIVGQYLYFAFGVWIGSTVAIAGEILFRDPPSQPTNRDLPFEWLIVGYIPLSLLLSIIFASWIAFRSRASDDKSELPWIVPLLLGLTYFPVLFTLIPLLIWLTGQGQGVIIGLSISVAIFGLPVFLGEIAFRIRRHFYDESVGGLS